MFNKEKNFISAVVYMRNDEKRIETFLTSLIKILASNFEQSEIICVNDFSEDDTIDIITSLKNKLDNSVAVTIINLSYFQGLEAAMNAGIDIAIGDFVYEFNSINIDYTNETVLAVYKKLLEGYDIVSAVPKRKMKLSSKLFYNLYEKFSETHSKMITESFLLISRRAINRVGGLTKKVFYRKALYTNSGLKLSFIEYTPVKTIKAYEKESGKYRRNLAVDSLLLYTNIGYSISRFICYAMFTFIFAVIIYAIVIKIKGIPVAGWTSLLLFLAFSFLGIFVLLTFILKYVQLLTSISIDLENYNYNSVEKLKNINTKKKEKDNDN